ncbi:MAG: GatB/YqeY domain-containing protein [Alphaproteobacteria bacterium]|nr:GatB/YqeY domain-containing protein [Alphaproteobacteria bacterium]
MLREAIQTALNEALKSGQTKRLSTLRLISAALKDKDIAARTKGSGDAITDDQILSMLQTMIKQRQESTRMYREAGRDQLAEDEDNEIQIIREFMPKQMDHDAVISAINTIISEVGAASVKDMGKVMGLLKQRYTGQMDFASASSTVKDMLLNQ